MWVKKYFNLVMTGTSGSAFVNAAMIIWVLRESGDFLVV
jgi:hypothetical protein